MEETEISKEEFLARCLKYGGPNTYHFWVTSLDNLDSLYPSPWKFIVVGSMEPDGEKQYLDHSSLMEKKTVRQFFITEADARERYPDSHNPI